MEFEITKPTYFRILVEKRKDPEVGNILLPSIKQAKGSTVDVWFDNEESPGSRDNASRLLKSLLATLPSPPWEGLKFREARREKKKWEELSRD